MAEREDVQEKGIRLRASELSLAEKLDSLPTEPGVYQFKNAEGKVIYVGKAQNLRSRVRQYFQKSRAADPKLDVMVEKIADVELIVTNSEVEALILEANLIKKFKPRYNVVLKDDKSYPYIVITNEPFPRVFVTRRIVRDGSRYFGPYADVKTMRFALKTVRDIFMIRSCNYDLTEESIKKGKFKICLDYHIKKCEGPCEGLVSQEHYRTMIDHVASVLKGKTGVVVEALEQEMQRYAEEMRFEDAARVRDRIRALKVYTEKQRVVDVKLVDRDILAVAMKNDDAAGVIFRVREGKLVGSRHFYMGNVEGKSEEDLVENLIERYYLEEDDLPAEILVPLELPSEALLRSWLESRRGDTVKLESPKSGDKAKLIAMARNNAQFLVDELEIQRMKRGEFIPHSVKALQRDLRLSAPPRIIECFDISNIQGSDAVASMVVFEDAKPKKSEYRHFRIRTVRGPDDFASMREVVQRRYTRLQQEGAPLPDLIMVDGGKGQLSSAVEVLSQLGISNIPMIGLAKRLEEVFVPGSSEPLTLPRTSSGLRLLQQIRDEAHRFAITYHRTLRSRRILQTELDLVKGIGKKRAKELLEAFGSVQGVKFATEEQLAEIVG
ncbi:MAG TPA: excinuclease ABC subunit UvrC, partial [Bacteroidota bacterium]|nr:excinuclease ABC subunit UvrC [Bacteroidota bacterium]